MAGEAVILDRFANMLSCLDDDIDMDVHEESSEMAWVIPTRKDLAVRRRRIQQILEACDNRLIDRNCPKWR